MQTEEAKQRALRLDLQTRVSTIAAAAGLPGTPDTFKGSEQFTQWYWWYDRGVAVVLYLTMGNPYRDVSIGIGVQSRDEDGPMLIPSTVPMRFPSVIATDEEWLYEELARANAAARIEAAMADIVI